MKNLKKIIYWAFIINLIGTAACFSQQFATDFQSIPTNGANDWKSFKIGSVTYLALANYQNNTSVEINSAIYKWENNQFSLFQELPTQGASDWEYFSINSQHFLAVANYKSQTSYSVNSVIYTWNGDSMIVYQEIPTCAAYDWEAFSMNDTMFLAVASQSDESGNNNSYSTIYKWDGAQFDSIQNIQTHGASDWEAFVIDDTLHYLAVANTYSLSTEIFKWDGNQFVSAQVLSSMGTTGIESFSIDNDYYLATSNGRDLNSFNTNSKIFKWDGSQFIIYQQIPTIGAFDWEYFSINNHHFLCVANYQDNNSNYNLNSVIYKWDGSLFVPIHDVFTHGATDWEFLQIENTYYLCVANYKDGNEHNIDSKLLLIDETTLTEEINKRQDFSIKLFPNPTVNQFSISINSVLSGPLDVELRDVYGRLAYSQHVVSASNETKIEVHLPGLASGLYFCKAIMGENSFTLKLIVR